MSNKHPKCEPGRGGFAVAVRDNNIEKAIKKLKKMMTNEGFMKELKERKAYEKPSVKKRLRKKEAKRRLQKAIAMRIRHEGF